MARIITLRLRGPGNRYMPRTRIYPSDIQTQDTDIEDQRMNERRYISLLELGLEKR